MPLKYLPFLKNDTRLIRHQDTLYKVKVLYDLSSNDSNGCRCDRLTAHQEIEDVFRAILYLSERGGSLKPILTNHFIIHTKRIPWALPEKYGFSQHGKVLGTHRHLFQFTVRIRDNVEAINRNRNVDVTGEIKNVTLKKTEGSCSVSKSSQDKHDKGAGKNSAVLVEKVVSPSEDIPRFMRTADGTLMRIVPDGKCINMSTETDISYVRPTEDTFADKKESSKQKLSNTERARFEHTKPINNVPRVYLSPKKVYKTMINSVEKCRTKSSTGSSVGSRYKLRSGKLKPSRAYSASPYSLRSRRRSVHYPKNKLAGRHTQTHIRKDAKGPEVELHVLKVSSSQAAKQNRRHSRSFQSISCQSERTLRSLSKRKRETDNANERPKRLRSQSENKSDSDMSESKKMHETRLSERKSSSVQDRRRQSKRGNVKIEADLTRRQNTSPPREGARQHRKLYTSRVTPQLAQNPLGGAARLTSPRVSTVLPVKRKANDLDLQTPLQDSERRQLRSSGQAIGDQGQQMLTAESQRLVGMAGGQPTQMYRDILLGQSRDRHMVEQAERAETQKLQQLYEPVRRSPRNHDPLSTLPKRRSSGLWGKFMDGVVTPVKIFMSRK